MKLKKYKKYLLTGVLAWLNLLAFIIGLLLS